MHDSGALTGPKVKELREGYDRQIAEIDKQIVQTKVSLNGRIEELEAKLDDYDQIIHQQANHLDELKHQRKDAKIQDEEAGKRANHLAKQVEQLEQRTQPIEALSGLELIRLRIRRWLGLDTPSQTGVSQMVNRIVEFWNEWKNTSLGKAVEDFYWSILYTSVVSGGVAAFEVVMAGQADPSVVWGVFTIGVSVAFLKSTSVFRDRWRNPAVPDRP